jgi:hypothetical protein
MAELVLAAAQVPLWWTIVAAAAGAIISGLATQRAAERTYHTERRPVHSNYTTTLDELRLATDKQLADARAAYIDRYTSFSST